MMGLGPVSVAWFLLSCSHAMKPCKMWLSSSKPCKMWLTWLIEKTKWKKTMMGLGPVSVSLIFALLFVYMQWIDAISLQTLKETLNLKQKTPPSFWNRGDGRWLFAMCVCRFRNVSPQASTSCSSPLPAWPWWISSGFIRYFSVCSGPCPREHEAPKNHTARMRLRILAVKLRFPPMSIFQITSLIDYLSVMLTSIHEILRETLARTFSSFSDFSVSFGSGACNRTCLQSVLVVL
jgi:hypothetical protein